MRKLVAYGLLVALIVAVATQAGSAQEPVKRNPQLGQVRHVVLFKFKDNAPAEQVKAIEEGFRALPLKIPEIAGLEWGTNCSPEPFSQGFTHCFLVTFKDAKARDTYLPHPAHKAFAQQLGPYLDKVMVIDYVVKE